MTDAKRALLIAVVAGALLCAGCFHDRVDNTFTANVALRAQETAMWCWAATTEMVVDYSGSDIAQCDLANVAFQRTDCCQGSCPKNPACADPGWPMFAEHGLAVIESNTPLAWSKIIDEIGAHERPLAYAYGPKSGGVGHVLVIYGYLELEANDNQRYLYLNDPWSPCQGQARTITYAEYKGSTIYDHWVTFYNLTTAS